MNSRASIVLAFAAFGLVGCQVPISEAMLKEALVAESTDPDVLNQLCGRAIPDMETKSAWTRLTISNVDAKRSFFGKAGKGTAKVRYNATAGGACEGALAFDFVQETTTQRRTKRGGVYKSDFKLSNVVVSK